MSGREHANDDFSSCTKHFSFRFVAEFTLKLLFANHIFHRLINGKQKEMENLQVKKLNSNWIEFVNGIGNSIAFCVAFDLFRNFNWNRLSFTHFKHCSRIAHASLRTISFQMTRINDDWMNRKNVSITHSFGRAKKRRKTNKNTRDQIKLVVVDFSHFTLFFHWNVICFLLFLLSLVYALLVLVTRWEWRIKVLLICLPLIVFVAVKMKWNRRV